MNRKFTRALVAASALGLLVLIGWTLFTPHPAEIPPQQAVITQADQVAATDMDQHVSNGDPAEVDENDHETDRPEEEADGDKADPGGIAWRMLRWQDEYGRIPSDGLVRAQKQLGVLRRSLTPNNLNSPNQIANWLWAGPGNIGGRIRSILIDPTNANRMWVGSVSGGIWTTTDAGTNWQPVDDFMANLAVSALVMDPTNTNVLYAGTGEGFWSSTGSPSGISGIQGAGVFKSIDRGVSWAQLGATNTADWYFVNRLTVAPTNGQILLAATKTGIWRSTDGGSTWSQRSNMAPELDIAFHPTDNTRAIASGNGFVLVSTDGGQTWTAAAGLPPNAGRIEVAYAPNNPITVYASIDITASVGGGNGQIWRSTNDGQTFVPRNTSLGHLGTQGGYGNAIWVDPTNSNTIIVGGIDLWRSTDGGATFTQISNGGQQQSNGNSAHADQHYIVAHPQFDGTSNRVVYFANDGGIYVAPDAYTVNQTAGWQDLNHHLGITQFYGAAGNNAGVIMGGTQDNGTLRHQPGSGTESWTTTQGGDGGFAAADQTDPNFFYGEYVGLKLFRSTDGGLASDPITGQYWNGSTWLWKSPPYVIADVQFNSANYDRVNFIAPFVLDPNNPQRLLAGGISLWRTNDVRTANTNATGPSWIAIKAPTPSNSKISAIAIAPGNSDVVWVGHNEGDVYRTTNGSAASPTWSRVDTNAPGLPDRYVTSIAIDPQNANSVYVTFGGFTADNVWRTDDGGTTWNQASGVPGADLLQLPVNSLVVHPNYSQWVYAGTEVGIFVSENRGASWTVIDHAPSNVAVDQLFWMGHKLTAATHGRGVYQTANDLGPIFVSTTGTDIVTCGGFPWTACQTIPFGLGKANAADTLAIAGGSYNIVQNYTINKAITLRSTSGVVQINPIP